jgi:hypothetical protein
MAIYTFLRDEKEGLSDIKIMHFMRSRTNEKDNKSDKLNVRCYE